MKRLLLKPIIVGVLAVTLIGLLVLLHERPANRSSLPAPNGYDDLVKAGQMLLPEPSTLDDLQIEEMQSLVARNADALRLARAGQRKDCRVPVEYSISYMSNHMSDFALFKRLVRSFVAEGKLADRENRPKDAALAYLDAIRLGQECSRGGLIIDMLVGVAGQAVGCQAMRGLVGQLQAPDCREAIHQLEDMDSKSEPATEIVNRERNWGRRTFGWRGQIVRLMTSQRLKQSEQKTIGKLQAQQRAARQLLIDLAVRAYELENGQRPKNIADLVPNYLKALPRDPVSGTNLSTLHDL